MFEKKNFFQNFTESYHIIGQYHDPYVQSDALLLADLFGSFQNICIEIYRIDLAYFVSAPG